MENIDDRMLSSEGITWKSKTKGLLVRVPPRKRMKTMLLLIGIFASFCGRSSSCSVYPCLDGGFTWSTGTSAILSALGWTSQFSFDFSQFGPSIIPGDENSGLESYDHFGGDIIEDEKYRNDVKIHQRLWPRGRIPYVISRTLKNHQDLIKTAMGYIESKTCITFVPRRNEKNYIILYNGVGCHSRVGMYGDEQMVSLGRGCYKVGKVIHELLHVLGFYHEQSRPDRDKYIEVHWENVQKGHEINFVKMKPENILILNAYDYDSVMHYGAYSFSKDRKKGLQTMTPKKQGVVLKSPGDKLLSASDIQRICMLYKC